MSQLSLKRAVNVRAIVTQRWKDEIQQGLQGQINEVDGQLQQLEMQGQRAIAEIKQQSLQPPGPQVMQQIDNIQLQVLQQLQEVQTLELNQEVVQGQIESMFDVGVGDNLVSKMNVEILLRDGVVMEIRGTV
jgi:YlqD protein